MTGYFIIKHEKSTDLGKEDEFVFASLELEKGAAPPETVFGFVNINMRKE